MEVLVKIAPIFLKSFSNRQASVREAEFLYLIQKFSDKMQRNPQGNHMLSQNAQMQIIRIRLKRINCGSVLFQQRKVRGDIFRQKTAEHHVAVQRHTDIINPDGQMTQEIMP